MWNIPHIHSYEHRKTSSQLEIVVGRLDHVIAMCMYICNRAVSMPCRTYIDECMVCPMTTILLTLAIIAQLVSH